METIVRGLLVYFFLLVVFRLAGKRTLAQTTNFDLILLLIISETTQQAMVGEDYSLTTAFLLILTLVSADILLSYLKEKSPNLEKWLDGLPILIIEDGKMHQDRMARMLIDENDIMETARSLQGLERLEQIKYAVVERNGDITIIPKQTSEKQ